MVQILKFIFFWLSMTTLYVFVLLILSVPIRFCDNVFGVNENNYDFKSSVKQIPIDFKETLLLVFEFATKNTLTKIISVAVIISLAYQIPIGYFDCGVEEMGSLFEKENYNAYYYVEVKRKENGPVKEMPALICAFESEGKMRYAPLNIIQNNKIIDRFNCDGLGDFMYTIKENRFIYFEADDTYNSYYIKLTNKKVPAEDFFK